MQLWSDFIYMAPPFIAYYGALESGSRGKSLLQTAYEQVKLYREVLFDQDVGLWRHIALGQGTDPTHWATGNAWAVAGMLRVLATIQRSSAVESMTLQQIDLVCWVRETLNGVWKHQVRYFLSLSLSFNPKYPFSKRTARCSTTLTSPRHLLTPPPLRSWPLRRSVMRLSPETQGTFPRQFVRCD